MRHLIFRLAFCAALLLVYTAGGPARAGSLGSFHDPDRGEPFWGQGSGRGWLELERLKKSPEFPAAFAIERALGDHPHHGFDDLPDGRGFGRRSFVWTGRDHGGCHDKLRWLCGDQKSLDALKLGHHEKLASFVAGLRLVIASHHGGLSPVPEPGTAGMLLIGLLALSRAGRRRG